MGDKVLSEKPSIEDTHTIKSSPRKFEGFFQRKKDKNEQEKVDATDVDTKPIEQPPPSVGFAELFRYATPFELSLNAIGVVGAVAAGAAQVCHHGSTFTRSLMHGSSLL
ncbi:hypothetical protein F5J12DRAFT_802635 [Pisolithus orientalis]|uniref:uncharacterized protein n=1 Tax=Pisolithus orientalis TaxID=936130 RepID=UPI0022256C6A|nr:uncharacterized protein F5J12DRAFT_802635 [Pisolithus orientalis]KAI6030748.1 hypothetical protein F5J12DRAFT_802635 [Pisolithus orientalis]